MQKYNKIKSELKSVQQGESKRLEQQKYYELRGRSDKTQKLSMRGGSSRDFIQGKKKVIMHKIKGLGVDE